MTITVDQNLCTGCATCSDVCIMSVISHSDEGMPHFQDERAGACLSCGHCEAFCPTGALVQRAGPGSERAGAGKMIAPDQLGIYLKSRRSIRQYRSELVPPETIESVLDIARFAASGGNGQPVEWLVIHDPREVQKVAGLVVDWMREQGGGDHPMSGYMSHLVSDWDDGNDVICRSAPHLLIPHVPAGYPIAQTDAIIALTHVDVAAPAFGLGTCWAGFVAMGMQAYAPLGEFLDLPERRIPAYAMMLGYPRHLAHQIPERRPLRVTWK